MRLISDQSDGHIMLQLEVFMRVATNRKSAEKHFRKIEDRLIILTIKEIMPIDVSKQKIG